MSAYPIEKIYSIINELELDIDIIFIGVDISILDKNNIPDHSGIYIIKNNNGNRYIGSSENILMRQPYRYFDGSVTIDVFLIEDVSVVKELESILIFVLQPELNTSGKGSDLHKYLDENERIDYVKNTFRHKDKYNDYVKIKKIEDDIIIGKLLNEVRTLKEEVKKLKKSKQNKSC